MTDPVLLLQIARGRTSSPRIASSSGRSRKSKAITKSDIFDGSAVESRPPTQIRYAPGEQVGAIYPGDVMLEPLRFKS